MKQLGWFLVIFGLITLALFAFAFTVHRFRHDYLTETQLFLWSLERWWGWVPASAASFLGMFLVSRRSTEGGAAK